MASKILFFPMLVAFALYFSTLSAAELEARGAAPVIHFISAVTGAKSPLVSLRVTTGTPVRASAELSPGQDYQIKVTVNGVYNVFALFGVQFTSFNAYEPARDKGKSAIYWRADNEGFAFSYDNKNYKNVAPWESG